MTAALQKSSGPQVAKRAGCGQQTIYNIRDGRLPGRLTIPAIARALRISAAAVSEMVARDRSARAAPHAHRRTGATA